MSFNLLLKKYGKWFSRMCGNLAGLDIFICAFFLPDFTVTSLRASKRPFNASLQFLSLRKKHIVTYVFAFLPMVCVKTSLNPFTYGVLIV